MADFGCIMLPEGFDYTIPPLLKDIDFWFWKARMTSFIKAVDYDMWNVVTNVFDYKPRKDWTEREKKMFSLNIRAMRILFSAMTENDFERIRFCSNAKDIWDTLDSMYTSNEVVEVESVDSSSETTSCTSTSQEQLEDDEDKEIIEHFHDTVNTNRQEEEDSYIKLITDDYEKSLSRAQDQFKVKSSNSSYDLHKTNFQSLHKIVFQPVVDSIEKSKNVYNHARKLYVKKKCRQIGLLSLKQHNTCIKPCNIYLPTICNYCGKSGHISHTCYIRRNSNVRNKYVWVPKGHVKSNANVQGPKAKWVPKCPYGISCVQIDSKRNGHKGTKEMKKPRVSHTTIKKFISSQKRTLRASIARATKHNHKEKQWTKGLCSTSRKDYHRVPFNYIEENKKKKISRASSKRLLESRSFERRLLAPKVRDLNYQHYIKMHWVSKGNPLSI